MQVTIDGRDYVPATDTFRLTAEHIHSARDRPNGWAMIEWALDAQANAAEMRAWGRADRGEDLCEPAPAVPAKPTPAAKPDPKRPLSAPKTKPALFT